MSDLKTTHQHPGGVTSGNTPEGTHGENNQGAGLGASDRAKRGTDRDLDTSGESRNQGPRPPARGAWAQLTDGPRPLTVSARDERVSLLLDLPETRPGVVDVTPDGASPRQTRFSSGRTLSF